MHKIAESGQNIENIDYSVFKTNLYLERNGSGVGVRASGGMGAAYSFPVI
jgi:hypothetical protein